MPGVGQACVVEPACKECAFCQRFSILHMHAPTLRCCGSEALCWFVRR
jgi:hypothetical protein